jgi:protocatechuate 3,4-dioxygenase, beta subunit
MKTLFSVLISCAFFYSGCSRAQTNERVVGGRCEDCTLMFEGMPKNLTAKTSLSPSTEKGEPLIITGTVYKKDGVTPAPDAILYFYHTDIKGEYTAAAGQTHAQRHGHLRGWIKTGADGKYEIRSIRPASYPNSQAPQHIHVIVKEKDTAPYWIDEYLFNDDPFLSLEEKSHQQKRGGPGIINLSKTASGTWKGERNITLGLNVPGY